MPKHKDFKEIYDRFIEEYGPEEGNNIYFAFLHNEELDDTKSLASQKEIMQDSWFIGDFNEEHYNKFSHLLELDRIEENNNNSCGCDSNCNEHIVDSNKTRNIYKLKQSVIDELTIKPNSLQTSLNSFIKSEKERYSAIIDKWTSNFYNEGLQESARELDLLVGEYGNVREKNAQIKILQENSKNLVFNLMDDINKEVGLLVTDITLNNVLISNSELKKEIQSIFSSKEARLNAQVTTETDRAFNTALEFGYKKSGLVTHKQWVAVIDGKTSAICSTLNGEIVEIGKPFSTGDYGAPAHVNCRSRIQPLTISEKK